MSWAFVTSLLVFLAGFTTSAAWTGLGLWTAYRSGMKVWIGSGMSQARMLLLGLLLAGLSVGLLVPTGFWIVGKVLLIRESQSYDWIAFYVLIAWFVVLFAALPVLDWLSPKVVADTPGKFGPKVPTVGKWNSQAVP